MTAVSFAALPAVSHRYALLPCGASFGDGYGPVLIRAAGAGNGGTGGTVAIPGEGTTAALLLRLYRPGVRTAAVPFDRIGPAVAAGEYAEGVLIHEGQLTYARDGLEKIEDLGAWWTRETRLPVPLGGNAVRRDLGRDLMRRVADLVHRSVAAGAAGRSPAPPGATGMTIRTG